jgi:peptide/nickel transport system substrate-binding protein
MPNKGETISYVLIITVMAITIIALALSLTINAQQTLTMPSTIYVYEVSPTEAVQYFTSNKIDIYLNPFALPPNVLSQLATTPGIQMVSPAITSGYDLLFNPYPSNTTFNPFAYWQVRFLMNYLVDRSAIVTQVFSGYATPVYDWPGPFALKSQLLIQGKIVQANIHYNPTYVNQSLFQIFKAINTSSTFDGMPNPWVGRILYINHKWYYIPPNSTTPQPVTIIFFIRKDDPYRYAMGQMFMSALESLGFTVKPIYGTLSDALTIVYGSNPASMEWSIYAEAWTITPTPWDTSAGAYFCATWTGDMPGWGVTGYYQYTNSTINTLTTWVSIGNFTSLQQFENYSETSLYDCFQQAVRVWLVAGTFPYPIQNLTNWMPSVFGLEWPLGIKFAYSTTHPDTLNVGMLHVSEFPMNTFGWYVAIDTYTYDIIQEFTSDPFAYYNPFTGEPMPLRGSWYVANLSPNGSAIYPVPPNAVIWNATTEKWQPVGPGQYAKDVVYYYFNGTWLGQEWQDGQPISMADIIFYYYTWFDLAATTTTGAPDLGPNQATASDVGGVISTTTSTIVGMQFFPNGTVVVYGTYWFPDPNIVASFYAPGFPTLANPWVVEALEMYAYQQGKYAFTSGEAQSLKVPQEDFRSPAFNAYLASVLQNWISTGYIWDNGSWAIVNGYNFLGPNPTATAVQDYKYALNFYNTYGNFWISNGPYILKSISTVVPQSAVFVRWTGYPYNYTYWFKQVFVKLGVTSVPSSLVPSIVSVSPTSVTVNTTATLTISMKAVGNPEGYVYLINPSTGKIIYETFASSTTPGVLTVTIPSSVTATLTPGAYNLLIYAFTNIVTLPVQYVTSLTVSPPPPPPPPPPTPPPTVSYAWLWITVVIIVVVVVIAIGAWLAIRRRKR